MKITTLKIWWWFVSVLAGAIDELMLPSFNMTWGYEQRRRVVSPKLIFQKLYFDNQKKMKNEK